MAVERKWSHRFLKFIYVVLLGTSNAICYESMHIKAIVPNKQLVECAFVCLFDDHFQVEGVLLK